MASQLPPFELRDMPEFVPYDFKKLQAGAISNDRRAYARSDKDFAVRHPGVVAGEKGLEREVEAGFSGLSPMVQNEFMRAGLADALGSFGDTTNIGTGSGQAAAVGRSFGRSIDDHLDRASNRLSLAESLFPHRTIGMSGQDYVTMEMLNNKGTNDWNQADWANQVAADQLNYRIGASNQAAAAQEANAQAQGTASMISGGAGAIASIGMLALAFCWVARAVYGVENPAWRLFRKWMIERAPLWLFRLYRRHGEALAPMARRFRPILRPILNLAIQPWNSTL